ncbi:MAG: oxygenase MpaB family protein [Marmoricola sp.]
MTATTDRTPVAAEPFDFRGVAETLGFAGLSASGANIVMQLAMPGVGHGVAASTVTSGQLFKHPIKRGRTTFTYLAVSLLGTEEEQGAYRAAVNESHRAVRSKPGDPVEYNAFDPELQLWVAACLYRGLADNMAWLSPDRYEHDKEAMYRASAVLGTSLQMRADQWPADTAAFEEYWNRTVRERLAIDDFVRAYLEEFLLLRFLPRPLSSLLGPFHRWQSTGWLPIEFRELMGLEWSSRDQKRFDRLNRWVRRINALAPKPLRRLVILSYLYDFRLRRRFGKRLV